MLYKDWLEKNKEDAKTLYPSLLLVERLIIQMELLTLRRF